MYGIDRDDATVRIGRGSSRGRGRFLDNFQEVTIPIGRGRAMTPRRGIALNDVDAVPSCDRSPTLAVKLYNYVRSGTGKILDISLEYFENSNDYQYYIDKVIDACLQNPAIITDFTSNIRLITLMKIHGDEIKRAMFSKLQATFEKQLIVMKECNGENVTQRKLLENLCDLIGQLYYRFRVNLETQQRYTVLELPVIECMKYLLKTKGLSELLILFKMVTHNYKALCKNNSEKMNEFSMEIRSVLITDGQNTSKSYISLLVCVLECVNHGGFVFPDDVKKFYLDTCGHHLQDLLPSSSRRILADIPENVVNDHMDKFECSLESYTRSIFLSEEPC